jgi:rRNA maturation endonuclease Nob1
MSATWRWRCEVCADEFILSLEKIPAPCRRCGGQWFLKVGESEDDSLPGRESPKRRDD